MTWTTDQVRQRDVFHCCEHGKSTELFIHSMNTECLKRDSRIYFKRRTIKTEMFGHEKLLSWLITIVIHFFYCCTVHFDIDKFHSPINALCIKLDKVHIRETSLEPS